MGIGVIAIPIYFHSHSFSFPFPSWSLVPIPVGFLWDSYSHWESHFHGHLRQSPRTLSGRARLVEFSYYRT